MTKTSAAKRFASEHGVYDHASKTYSKSLLFDSDRVDRANERTTEARAQHTADLKTMMALLGVEDQYEDTVEERAYHSSFGYVSTERVVTETAVQKFARDLRTAQSAIDGEAALKRLRKAVKAVRKEESK